MFGRTLSFLVQAGSNNRSRSIKRKVLIRRASRGHKSHSAAPKIYIIVYLNHPFLLNMCPPTAVDESAMELIVSLQRSIRMTRLTGRTSFEREKFSLLAHCSFGAKGADVFNHDEKLPTWRPRYRRRRFQRRVFDRACRIPTSVGWRDRRPSCACRPRNLRPHIRNN